MRTYMNVAMVVAVAALAMARPAEAVPFSHTNNFFTGLGPGETLHGVAAVDAGVLKLTTPINSVFGAFTVEVGGPATFDSFSASWRSLIGGGTGGGADGYSFNVGAGQPFPPAYAAPGEDPSSPGLGVGFDTFDNGGSDVGIEMVWNGVRVAYAAVPKDDDGSGNFLRKNAFVDVLLTVTPSGLATLTYDGNVLAAQLPGFNGLQVDRFVFGARTGGANDNHWIDDLSIRGEIRNGGTADFPEPSTLLLLGAAAGLLATARRRTASRH